jgi:hypothetical protein
MAELRHTATLAEKIAKLRVSIGTSIETGAQVKVTYAKAEAASLDRDQARMVFDALFPEAPKDASAHAKGRAESLRDDARRVATLGINRVGHGANVATIWNAATYLVDRQVTGQARQHGDSDGLNSLVFGARGERVAEIQRIVEIILRDGSIRQVTPVEALHMGVDPRQNGVLAASLIDDILAG